MLRYHLSPDPSLTIKDPAGSPIGIQILEHGLVLMNELGLEEFTFKKLAQRVPCTEATVYHYFSNKQRLLQYYIQLYWMWLGAHMRQQGLQGRTSRERMAGHIEALCGIWPKEAVAAQLPPAGLRELVLIEGSKAYLHKHVDSDNALRLFKPYKELCALLAEELVACDAKCTYPRSFATTLVEMSHSLEFAMHHLPALTELSRKSDRKGLAEFLLFLTARYFRWRDVPLPAPQRTDRSRARSA